MKSKIAVFLVITLTLVLATGAAAVFPDSWVQSNTSGCGDTDNEAVTSLAVYDEGLWAGTYNESGAQLHKLSEGSWSPVITDGFTNTNNIQVSALVSFKSTLYGGTENHTDGAQILRSADGVDWEVVTPALDSHHQDIVTFTTFQGKIYAATASYSNSDGTEIWRSNNGDAGSWTRVVANGFNNDGYNQKVVSIEEYQSVLYAGVYNVLGDGAEVWSSEDGESWSQVNTDGFGDSDNLGVILQDFGGYLFAGTYYKSSSLDPGAELWRCELCDGSDWGQVPIAKGFGDTGNRAIKSFEIYNNLLYAVTYNTTTGMEVWVTSDGTSWEQANLDGFGDSSNTKPYWDNSVENFQNHLYVGTENETDGGEIWGYYETRIYLPVVMR